MKNKIKLLETTLRDGSYTINYQFNANETRFISSILDEIGFEYIEIGPGVGLNAKSVSEFAPASTDEEYIIAAREVVKHGKIGMFFIPGIGRMEDITMAAQNGLDMIRIGTDINENSLGFKYIEACKKYGIETAANLMKSYAVSANTFGKIASECYEAGADIVYLVDSAGGMMTKDVCEFLQEAKNINPEIRLGFHGHDNLGLAIANTMAAIDNGAEVVDCSIRGMGRSSGNTITEKLILVMKRYDIELNYNMDKLFELSEKIILPYLSGKPENALDIIFGFSQFHSSYFKLVKKYADQYQIDSKDLIIEYTKIDKLDVDEEKLNKVAAGLAEKQKAKYSYSLKNKIIVKNTMDQQLLSISQELLETKHKYNKKTYFNLAKTYNSASMHVSPVIHYNNNFAFGSAEIQSWSDFIKIDAILKDKVDGYLVDSRLAFEDQLSDRNMILYYDDANLYAEAITNHIISINNNNNNNKTEIHQIFVDERDEIKDVLISNLKKHKLDIVDDISQADAIIAGQNYYLSEDIANNPRLKWGIISRSRVIDPKVTEQNETMKFIRISLENEIFSVIMKRLSYKYLFDNQYGVVENEGKLYCSGGFIGKSGAVVVDNIHNISKIYGVSNGDGSITYNANN